MAELGEGLSGYLDVQDATLRAPRLEAVSNIGIANTAPQHAFSVGSNLYVDTESSNVLTVDGNVVCEGVKVGLIEIIPSYDLAAVSNVGNVTQSTIQFSNATTGFVTTANIEVGTANLFVDTVSGRVGIGKTDPGSALDVVGNAFVSANLEVGTANLFVDTVSGRVGIGTTNPNTTFHVVNPNATTPSWYNAGYLNDSACMMISENNYNVESARAPSDHYTTLILSSDHAYDSGNNAAGSVSFAAKNEFGGYSAQYGQISGVRLDNFYGGLSFATMHNLNDGKLREDMKIVNGNVGIGTDNPEYKLHVEDVTNPRILLENTDTVLDLNQDIGSIIFKQNDSTGTTGTGIIGKIRMSSVIAPPAGTFYGESANMIFSVGNYANNNANTDALTIRGNGSVGIGTTDPSATLQVYDNTNTKSLLNVRAGPGGAARSEINSGIRFDTYSVESYGAGGSTTADRNYHIRFNQNRQMALYYDGDDLEFWWGSGGNYVARASVGSGAEFGWTFTGQHRNFIKDISYKEVIDKQLGGLIVCANNNEYVKISDGIAKGSNAITQNEALPIVSLSLKALDKSCFGVISESEDPNSNRGGSLGMFKSYYDTEDGDKRIIINSVGEGAIWVTNINGSLESGDYITTSNVAGYGQKQDSEFLTNYTVAKITMDCDFEPVTQPIQQIKKEMGDVNYWVKTTYENVTEEEYLNLADESRRIVDDIYQEIIKEVSKTEQEGYELEVRQELVNVLDEHGQIQWEDDPSGATEKAYKIRYLDADGNITDEANAVHKAAFVGCTYHCG